MFRRSPSLPLLTYLMTSCLVLMPPHAQSNDPEQQSEKVSAEKKSSVSHEPLISQTSAPDMPPQTEMEKLSYSVGTILGKRLQKDQIDLDKDTFVRGLFDAYFNRPLRLNDQEIASIMRSYNTQRNAKLKHQADEYLKKRKAAEKMFLDKQAKVNGVKVMPSGLQYKVLSSGSGQVSPSNEQQITFHYKTFDQKGTEVESSLKNEQGITARVSDLLPGWQEAFQQMKEGERWRIVVPSELAYGPKGTQDIPPYSPMIFELELKAITQTPPGL